MDMFLKWITCFFSIKAWLFRELCDSVDRELFAGTDDGHSYFKTNYANEISGRLHI